MNNKFLITLLLGIFSYCISSSAIANKNEKINNTWAIIHAEGLTQSKTIKGAQTGAAWEKVNIGDNLIGPIYLRTGSDARIVLKHRNDKITIASNSLLKLEAESRDDEGVLTRIVQTIGYALFDIEKNSGRTNIVETPYLVSVVKGTTFSVQVGADRTVVNLIEGRLQINATKSNHSTTIHTGQTAQLAKGDQGISVIDVAAHVKSPTTANVQSTEKSSGASSKNNKSNVLSAADARANNIGASTVPASINSVVIDGVITAGKSGNIIIPGNNGINGFINGNRANENAKNKNKNE